MDFFIVVAEDGPASTPECLYMGRDAAAAEKIYLAQGGGQVAFFRLYRGQAYQSRDLSVQHGVVHGTAKPAPALKVVNAADLPGPKPGEVVHDITTGQDLIRPAANPHQVNVLPADPVQRAATIQEAEDYRDGRLATEVAPADPEKAKELADERAAAETKLAETLEDSPLLPTKTTIKASAKPAAGKTPTPAA